MATVDQHLGHPRRDNPSSTAAGRHHGQDDLAEVIMIRPERSRRPGLIGSLVTIARVFASPRAQAAPVRSTPRPPSSPAPLSLVRPGIPHDAA